ncbi:ATP-dependent Clp protease ATP-binding subunit ClpA [Poseidonibacter lekithochrous]|uniref:ATP-dependent Clp protease ATP-binding subunit ClpA n=1 Tax=Poseidonibacter TaxID=2321187 RepID=UPI001C092725|nr:MULTISPECIES: ATP-dependent Clp protease ATP-binding subunit ClpA [Poseidonibacter]MBU3015543.1 ATP-dependent Clp protease ATP-binding subunit ClpA [Poseidonibacter lekithochrous]MDO6828842.1 ATP-dependent Clp protease ATP-binding subunit ClpA [Poseidonibacter sp. 1_MG-2023]
MISKELRSIFSQAVGYAKSSKHEYLTIEHIFLMLLHDESIENLFIDLGVDSNKLFDDTKKYIDENTPKLPEDVEDEPLETISLTSTIEYMVAHTQTSGRGNATVEDMFVAILKDEKSYALYLLRTLGIERIDILEEISHKEEDEVIEETEDKNNKVLDKNSSELVAVAQKGEIDPVIGREKEISRVIEILSRRKKNNPILVGEPGVGKTAIAEGLALQIAEQKVPEFLFDAKVFSLDMGSMIAGTKYRGDFEKKLKSLLQEVIKVPNAILFIDEIHTIVGAGSVGGSAMDASNILKPMLSNGKLRCIGATTFAEYRNDFSKDKALSRRFAKVDVEEPSIEDSILILDGLKSKYEEFHGIKYSKAAIRSAVELSKKYITDRFLPDCAIDVIDEVGASKKISLVATLKTKSKNNITVSQEDIENTVAKMAHIPAKSATKSDLSLLKSLEKNMQKRVYGQDSAITTIVQSIKRNKAGLGLDKKPIGSFLFTGPTGVGKTEVAKELSLQLGVHFERFDMSEYMEAHTISRLIGAPAGYVGFEQGGLLTEAIRKHPHTVLLLDEIEKAHPDLMSVLLQVMDNAELTDNAGNKADFQNVILVMTSNLGATEANVMGFAKDDNLNENKAITKFFAPEFRNRLDSVVSFESLSIDVVTKVVSKFISDLEEQLGDKNIKINITNKAKKELATIGYDKAMGARPLNRVISDKIKNVLTDEILFGKLKKGGIVNIDYKDEFTFEYVV